MSNVYIVVEKVCGDPHIRMVTSLSVLANEFFAKLLGEICPAISNSERRKAIKSSEWEFDDDCAIYIKQYDASILQGLEINLPERG